MSQSSNFYVPSSVEQLQIRSLLAKTLDVRFFPELLLTKKTRWIALPIESSAHFGKDDVIKIANAIGVFNDREFYAVALEPLLNHLEVLKFPATEYGVEYFNYLCGHFNYALFSNAFDWLIICSTDDYFIAIGNDIFVESVYGGGVGDAYSSFEKYANKSFETQELLKYVYTKCRVEYAQAPIGAQVTI